MSSQLLFRNEFSSNLAEAVENKLCVIQGALQKNISNCEGQYPTFSLNKIHKIYTNIIP